MLLLGGAVLIPEVAHAAITGNIAGIVTDQTTSKALAGVTVTVSGSALQAEQTEFTDSSGRYIITELPPGEYLVRFYFSNIKVERPGVFLNADKTLQVNASMPTNQAKTQTYRIVEKAPTVDVGNTQVQTQVTSELVRNTPINGNGNTGRRTYESVLTLAPGAATDAVGFSFNGSTGPENNFLIDGVNTTNPAYGLVGTQLTLEFIKETEIITGGYNAEYGRATGAVVNIITKSGSNKFSGGVWFYYTPFQLGQNRVARLGEAIASKTQLSHAFDFGFDIGGPIVKDRVWFYAGFAPTFTTTTTDRILRNRTADNLPSTQMTGTYLGDIDAAQQCPKWLAKELCPSTAGFITRDIPGATKTYATERRLYNWIAKLTFQLNENNSLSLQYIGSPSTADGRLGGLNGSEGSFLGSTLNQTHDLQLRFTSKLLDRKLQVDLIGGFHFEEASTTPNKAVGGDDPQVRDTRVRSLSVFERVDPCRPSDGLISPDGTMNPPRIHGVAFNPCPVSNYRDGGFGFRENTTNYRINVLLGITYFARLAGTHALKLGFDFEDNFYRDLRGYTGDQITGGFYSILTDNSIQRQSFVTKIKNPDGTEMAQVLPGGFEARTDTFNESLYVRDSWNVGFLPGLTINAGIRFEFQQVRDVNGKTQINITDNIAPRVGFVYDFTRKGYSKIYASYGRFFESIPLDINDRQFSGEGLTTAWQTTADQCMGQTNAGRFDPKKCVNPDGSSNFPKLTPGNVNGGSFGAVSPGLKGQFSNEVVAGIQYDVGLDLVLGAAYVHRDLGRVIEDISPDGGITYIIANPGEPTDPGVVRGLQSDIDSLQKRINSTTDPMQQASLKADLASRVSTLSLYQGVANFEKPKRDYNALVLTATKRFSHNFAILASYTYSRTIGNYPGLFQDSNGQLDPNISTQYDLRDLIVNRNGPLPNDRPHNFKLLGNYSIKLGEKGGAINLGLQFNVLSGTPIEVLGRHPLYGARETFILPRGSGGRTPTITSFDLHISYGRQFGKLVRADIVWDIFNVINQREVTVVDAEYTVDRVLPIVNGTLSDLAHLKNTAGVTPIVSPNFGQPVAYQAPLSMRFGIRVSF